MKNTGKANWETLSVEQMIKEFKKSEQYKDWEYGDFLFKFVMDMGDGLFVRYVFQPGPGHLYIERNLIRKDVMQAMKEYARKVKFEPVLRQLFDKTIHEYRARGMLFPGLKLGKALGKLQGIME